MKYNEANISGTDDSPVQVQVRCGRCSKDYFIEDGPHRWSSKCAHCKRLNNHRRVASNYAADYFLSISDTQ